jgi:Bifunctional DNA primase/polymerase, N-terminal
MLDSGGRLSPLKLACRFEEAIRQLWGDAEYADCNIGCFFPRDAQLNFVVDIDSIAACEKLLGRPLSLTGVAEVQSSTPDKRHVYFSGKVPDWFWAFNAAYTDATGKEHELFSVRNSNRYTVGPGSIHPSGATYSWLNGEPSELPPANEALLRELQQIAEASGCTRPDPKADGEPMPPERYEAWLENLRDNFERLGLPDYEERISRRHGGIEFVFHPCPLGEHDSGNNTGLITVAPSGRIGWHCFHSSHTMPWREARTIIEDQAGTKFTFPSGPEVIIGSPKSEPESTEEAHVEFPPDSVKRLEIDRADYIDFLAQELTDGTKLPFSFARETLKLMLLAALPKKRPALPWFHTLHTRQYVVLVSEKPGTGKGETWRRARATMEKAEGAFKLEFISGDSLGSPQWACVALGGERQSAKKVELNPKKPQPETERKSGIHVEIGPNGRVVFYDEGRKLFQQDSVGKGQDRGLLTMFTSLFESNQHATGSFANGVAEVTDANASLMLHFTRDGFDKCFTGSGATRDGFLSRCCMVSDYGNEASPDWKIVNRARVRELVEALKGCLTRTDLPEEEAAKQARHEYVRFLQRQDPLYSSRLQFLFTQDLYARALFSSEGRITVETVRRAIVWTQHQLLTRQALWPLDTSSDKFERMYLALRAAYSKHKTLSVRTECAAEAMQTPLRFIQACTVRNALAMSQKMPIR